VPVLKETFNPPALPASLTVGQKAENVMISISNAVLQGHDKRNASLIAVCPTEQHFFLFSKFDSL